MQLDAGRLISALNDADVAFVIIGGFAVSAHGYPRGTKDLDIVPDPAPENLRRLADLLQTIDATPLEAADFEPEEMIQPDLEALAAGGSFVLATSFGRLDIMQYVGPEIPFAELAEQAVEAEVFGQEVRFCGFDHLLAMKKAAGRPEDLLDLDRLQEARECR